MKEFEKIQLRSMANLQEKLSELDVQMARMRENMSRLDDSNSRLQIFMGHSGRRRAKVKCDKGQTEKKMEELEAEVEKLWMENVRLQAWKIIHTRTLAQAEELQAEVEKLQSELKGYRDAEKASPTGDGFKEITPPHSSTADGEHAVSLVDDNMSPKLGPSGVQKPLIPEHPNELREYLSGSKAIDGSVAKRYGSEAVRPREASKMSRFDGHLVHNDESSSGSETEEDEAEKKGRRSLPRPWPWVDDPVTV